MNINACQVTQMITTDWWNDTEQKIANCLKKSGIIFSSEIDDSSLEDINLSERLWENVFFKTS
jgi:hypothetical protein